jgi:hypothetical protein
VDNFLKSEDGGLLGEDGGLVGGSLQGVRLVAIVSFGRFPSAFLVVYYCCYIIVYRNVRVGKKE